MDQEFTEIFIEHSKKIINFFIAKKQGFYIIADKAFVKFDPKLPENLSKFFINNYYVFGLEAHSLATANIQKNDLIFEAAFGENDFLSQISISLYGISEICLGKNFIVYTRPKIIKVTPPKPEPTGNIFLQNPRNFKVIKDKK